MQSVATQVYAWLEIQQRLAQYRVNGFGPYVGVPSARANNCGAVFALVGHRGRLWVLSQLEVLLQRACGQWAWVGLGRSLSGRGAIITQGVGVVEVGPVVVAVPLTTMGALGGQIFMPQPAAVSISGGLEHLATQ